MANHSPAMASLAEILALDPTLPDVKTLASFATLLFPTVEPYRAEMRKGATFEQPSEGILV